MKHRVIWKMFALTIVTLGIYRLYWFIKTRKEMMAKKPGLKILTPWFLLIPVVLLILAMGSFIGFMVQSSYDRPEYCNNNFRSSDSSYDAETKTYVGPDDNYLGQRDMYENCNKITAGGYASLGLFYVAILAFWPLMAIWIWSYSKGVDAITKGHTSFAMAMIVLLLVPDGIDILIIQDGFNKLSASKPA